MSEGNKTHYRKVFKSDHLAQADLEDLIEAGKRLVFTIKQVRQEYGAKVAGHKIDANIAYFEEDMKPWVVNAGNSAILKRFAASPFVEDWAGLVIELYIDPNVKMKGETTGGVRVSPNKPKMGKLVLTPENTVKWSNAIKAYQRDGNLDKVLARCDISEEYQEQIRLDANVA